jgi:hypothetical protein
MTDHRRITLIARNPRKVQRDWDLTNPAGSHLVFVDSLKFLPYALDQEHDVERVIIDGAASALQFLEFLTTLPTEFAGDVISIGEDGKSFLSSVGRGDGRVLYALNEEDFHFYLQVNSLTWAAVQLQPRQFALA